MISNTPPIKMGFIESFKNTGKTFSNAFKKIRQQFPILLKNNAWLFSAMLIFPLVQALISPLISESKQLRHFLYLMNLNLIFLLNIRLILVNFSNEGYLSVGWKGIKLITLLGSKGLGHGFIMVILIILQGLLCGILGGLIDAFLSYLLCIFAPHLIFKSEVFQFFFRGEMIAVYLYLRLAFFSLFKTANMQNPFKENLILTKYNRNYIFWIMLISFLAQMSLLLAFIIIENILLKYSFFLKDGISSLMLIMEFFVLSFPIYFELEVLHQTAFSNLRGSLFMESIIKS